MSMYLEGGGRKLENPDKHVHTDTQYKRLNSNRFAVFPGCLLTIKVREIFHKCLPKKSVSRSLLFALVTPTEEEHSLSLASSRPSGLMEGRITILVSLIN